MAPELFEIADVSLLSGVLLPHLHLAYKTHGILNEARDNAILFPTWFGGQHPANEWIVGPGKALDTTRYFIIVVNILGNGQSSSPGNMPPPFDGPRFPYVSVLDNVLLQRRLLEERFGIQRLKLVIGRSMGAQIAFQWSSWFPEAVATMLALAGSARTSHHNYVFLDSVKMAIHSDPAWLSGDYTTQPGEASNRMRLIFDSWAYSQAYYRAGMHLNNFRTTREYLDRNETMPNFDANNMLAQVATWQGADISRNDRFNGNLDAALANIQARSIIMPSRTDLYFPPEDSALEVMHMPNATLRVIESVWGHRAGGPGSDPADIACVEQAILELLDS